MWRADSLLADVSLATSALRLPSHVSILGGKSRSHSVCCLFSCDQNADWPAVVDAIKRAETMGFLKVHERVSARACLFDERFVVVHRDVF